MSFVQNHKTKRKTQFAFCYLHVDLKREPPFAPPPLVLTLAQPQTRGLCMLRNIDSDAARCLAWRCTGMRHDTATTPSINLMCRGGGNIGIFDFPQQHNETKTEPKFAHLRQGVTQQCASHSSSFEAMSSLPRTLGM